METFIQQLVNGLSLGAIYALIALGYSMVYGVMRLINFAHGDVYMVGAFAGYYIANGLGLGEQNPTVLGAIAVTIGAMAVCAVVGILIERLCYRYPSMLVDAITEHEAGKRLVAVKNVTVNEEFFQGHFPGAPTLPGVLMLESLSQVAAILLLDRQEAPPNCRIYLRGVNDAKFRRQVTPGDRLRLEISLGRRRRSLAESR